MAELSIVFQAEDGIRDIGVTGVQTCALPILGFFHPVTAINEDLGRHLLLGQIIDKTQTVPRVNLLSYTYPQAPVINSHWLSDVVFFFIYQQSGFNGLQIGRASCRERVYI